MSQMIRTSGPKPPRDMEVERYLQDAPRSKYRPPAPPPPPSTPAEWAGMTEEEYQRVMASRRSFEFDE